MTEAIDNAAIAKIRHVIGRVERIEDEIAGLNADKSEIYQEAKSFGLDVKALKALVAKRRKMAKDPDAFSELSDVIEIYEAALDGTFSRAHAREAAAETPHDPITGEIEPAGGCMADPPPQDEALAARLRTAAEAAAPNLAGKISVTVTALRPYRVTDVAPQPVAIDPDVSPLIADQAARMAKARALLGQSEAAE